MKKHVKASIYLLVAGMASGMVFAEEVQIPGQIDDTTHATVPVVATKVNEVIKAVEYNRDVIKQTVSVQGKFALQSTVNDLEESVDDLSKELDSRSEKMLSAAEQNKREIAELTTQLDKTRAEDIVEVNQRVDKVDSKVDTNTANIEEVKTTAEGAKEQAKQNEQRIDTVFHGIEANKKDIIDIQKGVKENKQSLEELSEIIYDFASQSDVDDLSKELTETEAKVDLNVKDIEELKERVHDEEFRNMMDRRVVESLRADKADKKELEKTNEGVRTNKNAIAVANEKIAANEAAIKDLDNKKADKTELAKTEAKAEQNKKDIVAANGRIDSNEKRIDANVTAIKDVESIANDAKDKASDNAFSIKQLMKNKADAVETKEALDQLTADLKAEATDRKKDTKIINRRSRKNAADIVAANGRIDANESAIKDLSDKKADKTELAKTEAKAEQNKKDIVAANGKIKVNEAAIKDLGNKKADKTELAKTEAKAEQNKKDIAAAKGSIAANKQLIQGLDAKKADKEALNAYAKKSEVALKSHKGDIDKNKFAIEANAKSIKMHDAAIKDLDQKVEKTGALSAALAGLQGIAYDPAKPTQIMGSVARYKGENAFAFGISHYTSQDFMLHGGMSFTDSSDVMANIGATVRVGSGESTPITRDAEVNQLRREINKMKLQHEKEMREMKREFEKLSRMMKK